MFFKKAGDYYVNVPKTMSTYSIAEQTCKSQEMRVATIDELSNIIKTDSTVQPMLNELLSGKSKEECLIWTSTIDSNPDANGQWMVGPYYNTTTGTFTTKGGHNKVWNHAFVCVAD